MSSKVVNVKLRVTPRLHEELILPLQKDRQLAPIIVALLELYTTDEAVYTSVREFLSPGVLLPSVVDSPANSLAEILRSVEDVENKLEDTHQMASAGAAYFEKEVSDNPNPMHTGTDQSEKIERLETRLALLEKILLNQGVPVESTTPYEGGSADQVSKSDQDDEFESGLKSTTVDSNDMFIEDDDWSEDGQENIQDSSALSGETSTSKDTSAFNTLMGSLTF